MRPPFPPRPDRSGLLSRELHEIVRDYPETLRVFRRHGVDLREQGTDRLEEAGPPEDDGGRTAPPSPLVHDLLEALSWRRSL